MSGRIGSSPSYPTWIASKSASNLNNSNGFSVGSSKNLGIIVGKQIRIVNYTQNQVLFHVNVVIPPSQRALWLLLTRCLPVATN